MTQVGSCTPQYDANGDVTNDCLNTYSWDANGRPVTIDGVGATYDALGRMVELNRSGTYTEIAYDPMGGKLALMNGQSLLKAFVPLSGGATAVYTSGGLDHYRHSDWLGSDRLMTSPTQAVVGDVAYSPYGETYAQSGITDFSFTGMNDDADPANPPLIYDFPAREYGIQGRWPSPDPAGLLAVNPGDPQSWNRYAYVDNNPLAATDPTGLWLDGLPINPADGGACWVCDIAIGVFDVLELIFGHHHHHPHHVTPQAPPAPDGGYGAGIEAFSSYDETIPNGVQVFPPILPDINSYRRPGSHARWQRYNKAELSQIRLGIFLKAILDKVSQGEGEMKASIMDQWPLDAAMAACLIRENIPIMTTKGIVEYLTDNGIEKVLTRIGLKSAAEVGGIAGIAGTYVGTVIGCAREVGH
jgi:RHS repeat-associated protein